MLWKMPISEGFVVVGVVAIVALALVVTVSIVFGRPIRFHAGETSIDVKTDAAEVGHRTDAPLD